ncbi:hypothetical protein [Enterococcus ratti]|uniref:Uncharacterized protein n=1 Tax=Enterococcus ratti TaxID=150033 RepID=A0A1L8WS82_9ENTE|nr:hypothetical protein [Enterococcus ratti]OJG83869.1 hypothetical protein RV14_GL000046 [Enterococcus ratti]
MKSMRRLGLVLMVLFSGIIIGNFGIRPALLVFTPLFTLWFMLWDEKKYRQSEQHRIHEDPFYRESYYHSRHS